MRLSEAGKMSSRASGAFCFICPRVIYKRQYYSLRNPIQPIMHGTDMKAKTVIKSYSKLFNIK
jgi:hypothetical protein